MSWWHTLREDFTAFYAAHEYPALFGLIVIEEMGLPLPLPSDTLIAYSGTLERHSWVNALVVIGIVALAAAIGSSVLYYIARRGGTQLLDRLTRVRILHLDHKRIARMQTSFQRHGPIAIIVGRLIPGLRIPTSVVAGLAGVPYRVFAPSTALAAVIWAAFYYYLGEAAGRALNPVWGWATRGWHRYVGILVVFALIVALIAYIRRDRGDENDGDANVPEKQPEEARSL